MEMIPRDGIIAGLLAFAAVSGSGFAQPDADGGRSLVRLEGEYADYFKVFSEARAYPLGINIVFYLMTH